MINRVTFAGSGHGGIVAFKSLQQVFTYIDVVSDDMSLLQLLRKEDSVISSITAGVSKIIVCAGYHKIISKDVVEKYTIINTHPSLLPKYRGMHGLAWAMLNQEKELGFSIHLMNEFIDDGDILEQYKILYSGQTSKEVMDMFDDYVENNLGRVVQSYLKGDLKPVPQNKSEATWVAKRNIEDCIIDYNKNNDSLRMMFKVLVPPYPLPIIKVHNTLYEVKEYKIIDRAYEMHNGRVENIENDEVYIKIKDGLLIIDELLEFGTDNVLKAASLLKIGQRL